MTDAIYAAEGCGEVRRSSKHLIKQLDSGANFAVVYRSSWRGSVDTSRYPLFRFPLHPVRQYAAKPSWFGSVISGLQLDRM